MANLRSGVGINDNCKITFWELKRKKIHRYIVYKIDQENEEVVVEKTGSKAQSHDEFTASLPENDCRYALLDFDFVTDDNCQKSKIFFIAWSPETSGIRAKVLYASSKDGFCRELEGVHYKVQATESAEVGIEAMRDRAK